MAPLVLIPARMAATRLPGKPLADIAGEPMIVRVMNIALEAGVGRVAVATDSLEIVEAVESAGGEAVMTRAEHPSGSDRIHEAAQLLDPEGRSDIVVNVQGDFPDLDPFSIKAAVDLLDESRVDIGTLAAEITDPYERTVENVVKAIGTPNGINRMRALYFTRATAPSGEGPLYHHIGLYAFRREALDRFVKLPQSPLEYREKLEQLRALENNMRIDIAVVSKVPLGVDTPESLERVRTVIEQQKADQQGKPA